MSPKSEIAGFERTDDLDGRLDLLMSLSAHDEQLSILDLNQEDFH